MTTGNKLPRGVLVPAEKRYRPKIQGKWPFLLIVTGSGRAIPDARTSVTSNRYGEQAYGRSGPPSPGRDASRRARSPSRATAPLTLPRKLADLGLEFSIDFREGELDEREAVRTGALHAL